MSQSFCYASKSTVTMGSEDLIHYIRASFNKNGVKDLQWSLKHFAIYSYYPIAGG